MWTLSILIKGYYDVCLLIERHKISRVHIACMIIMVICSLLRGVFYIVQVSGSSLMVDPRRASGLNGASGPDVFHTTSESPDNSTDSDEEVSVTNSEFQLRICTGNNNNITILRLNTDTSYSTTQTFTLTITTSLSVFLQNFDENPHKLSL